ncbi:hypothetical protein L195_g011390 [Trifolium pratense]|uniref:O-fucosyltransferase family protein n=1 Tax=Trifolium pratense TaxID=57577 RepID=A0A2K3PHD8_TRIPR|nr:hypothetical protein L195_g011390 [Trifolium pratense]
MAFNNRISKGKPKPLRSRIILLTATLGVIAFLFLLSSFLFTNGSSKPQFNNHFYNHNNNEKYLYWGTRIDCPGKHCGSCEGLGHQESSLRCALEEAIYLRRTFVMPSRMCINPIHNKKGILHRSNNSTSEDQWAASSCAMGSLYDAELMSGTVPVIFDDSKEWYRVLSTSMKLGARGVAHVAGVSRVELKENNRYSDILLINRTASPLSWAATLTPLPPSPVFFQARMGNGKNQGKILWWSCKLELVVEVESITKRIKALLGDYDAIHVRRGDKIKTRKDRFGVARTLHPHLDRDTRPEFILCRIAKWVAPGRTLFIASNERTPGFFSPLSVRYRLAYSSNYSHMLDPVIENNYQLFMIERLIMMGAKTFIRTFKEDETDLSLCDDPKKNTKKWQIPVYTADETC